VRSLQLLLALASAALLAGAPPDAAAAEAAEGDAGAPTLATPPRLTKDVPPELPPGTVFPAPEVTVVLQIDVAADGHVERVALLEGAGEPFDSAALAAARRYAFEPARLTSGQAVPVAVTYRLRIARPAPPPSPVRFGGRLLERGTRRPLEGVEVAAEVGGEVTAQAVTDAEGRFALEVPAAAFRVVALPTGHDRLAIDVTAKPGEVREETFYLQAAPGGGAYTAVVRGDRVRREVTKQVLPADEVAQLPGSQGDTLKAVLNLPGAARPSYLGGALILRGSAPGDSAAFVDGLEIPILYHFGGLRSTFAPRFLDSVEFVPGNFSADYGRLTGGIVNARVRDPSKDLVRGEADFNLYDAGVALEAPLSKSWSVGGAFRRSWIDTLLPLFFSSSSAVSFTTAPRFYDYQFIATYQPDERDKVRVLFFGSQDSLAAIINRPGNDPTLAGDLRARIAYHELQSSWTHVFSPVLRHESWIALGLQQVDTAIGPGLFFDLTTYRLDARSTFTWQAARGVEARAGLDLQDNFYDVALDVPRLPTEGQPPVPVSTQQRVRSTRSGTLYDPAAFTELRLSPVESVSIVPSVRLDWDSGIQRWSVDPRLMARWTVADGTVLKAAAGVYQQPPSAPESSRDLGNPDLLFQRSYQYSAGFEQRLRPGVDLDVTGFYKDLTRVVVRNTATDLDPTAPAYLNSGKGRIYGLEVLLRARLGERFFGWVAYTFQRSFRTDAPGDPERLFSFDQPHILTALASYQLSSKWALGGRFRLVSGNPYTPVTGSLYDATTDVYVPSYGATNSGRLGTFHALDVRVDRFWTYPRWRLSAYLDVQNIYNRANQEGWQYSFDYRQKTAATGLPILPILGAKAEW
jgi:TonB family protein